MKMLYKYPQAAFPYADLVETNRRRGKDEPGVRADRHRRLRRGSLLRRRRRVRQGRPERHPDPHQRDQPRAGAGRAAPAADALVPQHLELGRRPTSHARRALSRRTDGAERARARRSSPSTRRSGATRLRLRRRRPTLLFTENETNVERLYGAPNPTPYVKDGINDAVVDGRARGQPGEARHQGGGALSADDRARRGDDRCGCA